MYAALKMLVQAVGGQGGVRCWEQGVVGRDRVWLKGQRGRPARMHAHENHFTFRDQISQAAGQGVQSRLLPPMSRSSDGELGGGYCKQQQI